MSSTQEGDHEFKCIGAKRCSGFGNSYLPESNRKRHKTSFLVFQTRPNPESKKIVYTSRFVQKLDKLYSGINSLSYFDKKGERIPTHTQKGTYYFHIFATPHKNVVLISMVIGADAVNTSLDCRIHKMLG